MGTIRFSQPPDKITQKGKGQIVLIYSVRAQRNSFSTPIKLYTVNWDQDNQKAVYVDRKEAKIGAPEVPFDELISSKEATEINIRLDGYRQEVANIEKKFELDNIQYSSKMVNDELRTRKEGQTKKEKPSKFVYDFIDNYIRDNAAIRVKGSLIVYKSLKSHLQNFEKDTKTRIAFEDIDKAFFGKFQNYLVSKGGIRHIKGLSNTTVAKQLSTLKTFLGYAKDSPGIVVSEKYKDFKIERKDGEVIALTDEEFTALLNLELEPGSTEDHVRNAFVFSCSTGLRYSDLKQLSWENIKKEEIVIHITKKKERVPLTIPLTPFSRKILYKYADNPKPLEVISNQRMNDYLKGHEKRKIKSICEKAGITELIKTVRFRGAKIEEKILPKYKLIGVHTGRKTFVTLSLEKGMTAEEVMPISGHENYVSFKRYVKITDQRKKKAMARAWG